MVGSGRKKKTYAYVSFATSLAKKSKDEFSSVVSVKKVWLHRRERGVEKTRILPLSPFFETRKKNTCEQLVVSVALSDCSLPLLGPTTFMYLAP